MDCSCFSCLGAPLACYGGDSGAQYIDNAQSCNTSGTAPYQPYTAGTAGGVVNTAQNPLPAPDASGGNGSFLSSLQQVMTQGLSEAAIGATEYGLGALNDRIAVAASGQAVPAAAPVPFFSTHSGKLVLIAGGALLLFLILKK